jgi:type I restriction enzyme S subunit
VGLDNSNAKLFPKGSLLIGMYDTAALKMSILDRDAAFNQAVAGMKPNENIDLVFMLHALNFVKPEVLSLRRGVRQKNLSLKKIKNIAVAVPKLEEQRRVVEQLASISNETQRLEAIYQQKIAALNELKQSILQRAFSGELTAEVGDAAGSGAREVVAA